MACTWGAASHRNYDCGKLARTLPPELDVVYTPPPPPSLSGGHGIGLGDRVKEMGGGRGIASRPHPI